MGTKYTDNVAAPERQSGTGVVLLMAAAIMAAGLWVWSPAQARSATAVHSQPPVTSAPAAAPQAPPSSEHDPSDAAWLAMLLVAGVVAATVLNKQGH